MPRKGDITPPYERVMRRVEVDQETGCWNFTGGVCSSGYGHVSSRKSQARHSPKAHRLVYEHKFGPVPSNLQVCHTCDNRRCVNPEHLFLGTLQDNWADMVKKGRARWRSGVEAPTSKLTRKQVLEIRALRGLVPKPELSKWFNISQSAIKRLWSGRTYSNTEYDWVPNPQDRRCRKKPSKGVMHGQEA